MIWSLVAGLGESLLARLERFTAAPGWLLRGTLLALVVALLGAFPRPEVLLDRDHAPDWAPVLRQAEHPFTPQAHPPESHASKLAFRLTVPSVAHVLGLGSAGMKLLEAACGVALLALVIHAATCASGDRVVGVLAGLTTAAIHAGVTAFVEHRATFDGVALMFLCAAIALRAAPLVALSVVLAGFTDERALLGAGLLSALHLQRPRGDSPADWPCAVAVGAGCGAYLAIRWVLARTYGLETGGGGIGLGVLLSQVNIAPAGLWSGLEGGWLLVLAAAAGLVLARRWGLLVWCSAWSGLVAGVALCVHDVTRSMAYLLPVLPLALRLLRESEPPRELRRWALLACLLALACPTYYFAGRSEAWWEYPLPVQLLRYLR